MAAPSENQMSVNQSMPPRMAATFSPVMVAGGVVMAAAVLGACAVLYFFNPSTHGFYPICMFHRITGLNCPGCGGTRAAYQLLHGHFLAALRDNALFIGVLLALAGRGLWLGARRMRHRPATEVVPPKALWFFLVVTLVFGVLRNLPAFAFLSP